MKIPGMKLLGFVVLIASLTILSAVRDGSAQDGDQEGAALESVLDAIRGALIEAQTNNAPDFPPLKKVTLTLQTVALKEVGGKISFWVFSIGTTYENEASSKLVLEMVPPETRTVKAFDPDLIKSALARTINLAKKGILEGNKKEPRLVMDNIEIELKFTVKTSGSGGAKVTEILPIGIEASGEIGSSQIQTMKLVFAPKR